MVYPVFNLSRRPVRLAAGPGVDADDLRALKNMSPEDLVVMGRVFSCGRIVSTGEKFGILWDSLRRIGQSVSEAAGIFNDIDSKHKDLRAPLAEEKDIAALGAIAGAIVEKKSDWQVSYRKSNGEIQTVASAVSTREVLEKISLDPPDRSYGGALKYIQDHQEIGEKFKKASSLGNPGWFLYVLLAMILLALALIAALLMMQRQQQKWQDELIRRKAENEGKIRADEERLNGLEAKGPGGRTASEEEERLRLIEEIARLKAENSEIDKALGALRESGGVLGQLLDALGIRTPIKWIVIGSGIIFLIGLASVVLGNSERKPFAPKPREA